MKKLIISIVVMLATSVALSAQVEKMLGKWTTIDDKTNQAVSVVEIYKADNGLYYGKLVEMLVEGEDNLIGTMIIKDMEFKKGALQGGRVYDPDSGNTYYGTVKIDAKTGDLILRGSLDKAGLLGRSQTWKRR
ncbi:MAG: DUF2147 domain-containing protein [Bacteroidales bacterium]|nr:DUF2147 domain-containing protein [Bacteroidales bacterium]MBQ2006204.1 DUF2147 domain-containing protein [Bacteroidales bacterium]MBQ5582455.1 DUF2147 domain-containing protein [Bacteroidales bacterium]MBQ5639462.1 DUF2147 domain-containing protein [Bacteroidales bacterium]